MQPAPSNKAATVAEKPVVGEQLNSIGRKSDTTKTDIQMKDTKAGSTNEISKKRQCDVYSAVLGCEVTTPLSEFFTDSQRQNSAPRIQSNSAMPLVPSSNAAVSHKPLKFDPPTFKIGSNSPDMRDDGGSDPATEKDGTLNHLQDKTNVNVIPSYCFPSVKWDEKEVDLLVACSRRWISDLKRRKVLEDKR
ncbi:hypothetical protein ACHAWX_001163 [Stephanocyclus meneghinianus]